MTTAARPIIKPMKPAVEPMPRPPRPTPSTRPMPKRAAGVTKVIALALLIGTLAISGCAGMTGAEKGGTIGAVLGGATGALIAGIPTFGVAAPIGGVVGAGMGGALGAAIGSETVKDSQLTGPGAPLGPAPAPQEPKLWHGEQSGSYDAEGVYHGSYRLHP